MALVHYFCSLLAFNVVLPSYGETNVNPWLANGQDIDYPSSSFMGYLVHRNNYQCGATLISENIVLTAASCIHMAQEHELRVCLGHEVIGEGVCYKVKTVYTHPNFHGHYNDISVIQLESSVPANLATPIDMEISLTDYNHYTGIILGWGNVASISHQNVTLKYGIIDLSECRDKYANHTFICAAHSIFDLSDPTPENGDHGGPLLTRRNDRYFQAGIFIHKEVRFFTDNYIFTSVASHIEWIGEVMGKMVPQEHTTEKDSMTFV